MEAKQKAEHLVTSFFNLNMTWNIAKQSALICVEEILRTKCDRIYWAIVKNQIKKL
jgi:hypothetical protein